MKAIVMASVFSVTLICFTAFVAPASALHRAGINHEEPDNWTGEDTPTETARYAPIRQGVNEVNLAFSYSNTDFSSDRFDDPDSIGILAASLAYGIFATDSMEFGVNLQYLSVEDEDDFGSALVFASVHLPIVQDLYVFVGPQVGSGFGLEDDPIILGAFAGLKAFVADGGGAISIQPFFNKQIFDNGNTSTYGVLMGVSIFFR